MFTRIQYDVTFPTTGRRFKNDITFSQGLGAIIGANEQGKSLILEFLRFSLFGARALRGVADDYKTLKVTTWFLDDYTVERTATKATLKKGDETLATGTKPVNQAIVRLLGFGLDVFDVANSINQGEVERLGSMRPAERQRLVDSVVGLDKIEDLAKHASETALGYEREATAMERVLVEPQAPVEPECWPNRSAIRDFLDLAEKHVLELAEIRGKLAAPGVGRPTEPVCDISETEDQLRQAIRDEERAQAIRIQLQHLPAGLTVAEAEAEIEAYERWTAAQQVLREVPAPKWSSRAELELFAQQWDTYNYWVDYQAEQTRKAQLQHQIDHASTIVCPKCTASFRLNPETVEQLQAELAGLTMREPEGGQPARPMDSEHTIQAALARWHEIEQELEVRAEAEAVPEAPSPSVRREQLPLLAQRDDLAAELASLTPIPDAQAKLQRLLAYQIHRDRYAQDLAAYEADAARRAELRAREAELEYAPDRVAELRPIVARFAPHEAALAQYERDLDAYRTRRAQIDEALKSASAWRTAKDALSRLRLLIKQHLYPSLAAAASHFLVGMTGGQRRRIEITDGFEILVDNQALDTLSGSGKAVANLAIRLGLGRVLTHSVFPVVLADEVDASMDDFRAEQTADILLQCSRKLSQLLLVSHKVPEADYYIDLGGLGGQPNTA